MRKQENNNHLETETDIDRRKPANNITVSQLLSAISNTEYPEHVLETVGRVREWMSDMISRQEDEQEHDESDIFDAIFGQLFEEEDNGIMNLFERLDDLREFADIIPGRQEPAGKPDTIVVSITPPDYESGLRAAIDYAAVFNRPRCKRIWIISDTFIFNDVNKFSPHVDALSEQGITMRFILVTPWGWVELPLSGKMASKQQFSLNTPASNSETKKPAARRGRRRL
ncbi:MAG: hypothetical protein IJR35_08040 [Synergistaceae bacterium]|nr:hypothetical protein [Synergistaceae bacterium]